MKLNIEAKYARMPAGKFIKAMLKEWDTSNLRYFKIYSSKAGDTTPPQMYGVFRRNVNNKQEKRTLPGTCRISVAFKDGEFPRKEAGMRSNGKRRIEGATADKNILLVWGAAHEMYHYLCATGQLPYKCEDENMADAFADVYVYKFNKGVPVER